LPARSPKRTIRYTPGDHLFVTFVPRKFRALTDSVRRTLSGRTPDHEPNPAGGQAAVALVLCPTHDDAELLFIKRAVRKGDPWSGQMALPGGRRDPADPSLLATARRETLEETGVLLHEENCLGVLDDLRPVTPSLPPITVRPFVFALPEARPEVTLNHEASKHISLSLGALGAALGRTRLVLRGHYLVVDAFLVDREVIWGMTHRIIMPLLDLVNVD